jgi:VWFA-related protein
MCRWLWRQFGLCRVYRFAIASFLVLACGHLAFAQQSSDPHVLQTPQIFSFLHAPPVAVAPTPQLDPEGLIRIPVTVIDNEGEFVQSLSARDFSLNVDGEESSIRLFQPSRATSAALGVLVDVSRGMSFKSWHGGVASKVPFIQWMLATMIDKLNYNDDVFIAAFARRFHVIEDFTSDHEHLRDRLPMLRLAEQLENFSGDGIYESMLEGIAKLAHAPQGSDRRALLVFTNDFCDSSTHGVEDVIARAQFCGVTVYDVIVQGFSRETESMPIRDGIGRIAAETGGLTFVINGRGDGDRINLTTDKITEEIDNQYVLGFSVSPWGSHALPVELMLRHHPGMRARAPWVVRFGASDPKSRLAPSPAPTVPE